MTTLNNNPSSDTDQAIKLIQLKNQQFAEKQKLLFSYHLKKVVLYVLLFLVLLVFGKVLLKISDIFASQLSYLPFSYINPIFPAPLKPIEKTLPNSTPIKADISPICIASYKDGEHPGVIQNNTCVIAYGSNAIILSHYKKLPQGNYHWIHFNYWRNMIPSNAVLAGQEPIVDRPFGTDAYQSIRNLYICRDPINADYIGKIVDGVCNYVKGQMSRQADVYDVLVRGR
jgi:hypothetical protein